jgi:hypothetical protein
MVEEKDPAPEKELEEALQDFRELKRRIKEGDVIGSVDLGSMDGEAREPGKDK